MSVAGRIFSLPLGVLLGAVALTGAGVGLVPSANATSVAPLSFEQMVDASDLIARGTVADVWATVGDHGINTRVLVSVERTLKGTPNVNSAGQVEVLVPGGELDGNYSLVAGAPRYGVGESVVLLLEARRDGSYLNVALGGGKYTVKQNPADGTDMVVQFAVPYDRAWDYRFLPNPPVADRVSLAALETRISDRVTLGWDGNPIVGTSLEHLRSINHLQAGAR